MSASFGTLAYWHECVRPVFLSYADLLWLKTILAFIVFVLTINFILTMLMVLKRTHSLFLTELRDRSENISH